MEKKIAFDIEEMRQTEKNLQKLIEQAEYLKRQLSEEEGLPYEEIIGIYKRLAESLGYACKQYEFQQEMLIKGVHQLLRGAES